MAAQGSVTAVSAASQTWTPSTPTARGTVVVLVGRGEHSAVYERFGSRLAYDGYLVHALDSRSTDDLGDALGALDGPDPVVLVGSDTGALASLVLAERRSDAVAGAVLAGTPTSASTGGGSDAGWDAELDARSACPVHRGRLATTVDRGALQTSLVPIELTRSATGVHPGQPVLVVHGDNDSVAPLDGALELAARLPCAETVVVRGGRHDVLNDVSHRSVAAAIVLFLERLRGSADAAPVLAVGLAGSVGGRT